MATLQDGAPSYMGKLRNTGADIADWLSKKARGNPSLSGTPEVSAPPTATVQPQTTSAPPTLRGNIAGEGFKMIRPGNPSGANPNIPVGGQSQAAADWQASEAVRKSSPVSSGVPDSSNLLKKSFDSMSGAVKDEFKGRNSDGGRSITKIGGNLLALANNFGPHYDAYARNGNNPLDASEIAQLGVRDTVKSIGTVVGGALGGLVGSKAAKVPGALLGSTVGGIYGGKATDAAMDGIRRGANSVNEFFGGSPNYFEDSDVTLKNHGYDPNRTLIDIGKERLGLKEPAANQTPQPAATQTTQPAATQTAQPAAGPQVPTAVTPPLSRDISNGGSQNIGGGITASRDAKGQMFYTNIAPQTGEPQTNANPNIRNAGPNMASPASNPNGGGAFATSSPSQKIGIGGMDLNAVNGINARALDQMQQIRALKQAEMDKDAPAPGVYSFGASDGSTGDMVRDLALKAGAPKYRNANLVAQQLANEVSKRGQDLTHQATLRGQDVMMADNRNTVNASIYGHELTAQNARSLRDFERTKLGIEQYNKDREYGLNSDKYNHQQSQDALSANASANDALHKSVLNQLPFVKGEKGMEPDTAGAARYMAGAQAAVAARIRDLQARGDNEGATNLQRMGAAGLDETSKKDIHQGLEIKKRFDQRVQEAFGGAEGRTSNNPLDYVITGVDPKDPKKVVTRGGMKMDMNDVDREQLGNRFGINFDMMNPPTNRLIGKIAK